MTTQGLDEAVKSLAFSHTELTPAVEDLLRRAASDEDVLLKGVAYAAIFGAARIMKILTQGWAKDTLDFNRANQLLERAVMSDNANTVDTVRAFVQVSPEKTFCWP